MSEEQGEEKTEQPSQRKLRKARDRGDIARSQDLAMVISTIGGAGAVWMFLDQQVAYLGDIARLALTSETISVGAYLIVVRDALILLTAPVIIGGVATSLLGNFLANRGFVLAFEKIKPNVSSMSFSSYRNRTFSKKGAVELAKITLFVLILCVLYVQIARYFAGDFFKVFACGVECGLQLFSWVTAICIATGLLIALIMALADIRLQSFLFLDQQRSTKTEVKREMKEDMGEPVMRQERRRQHTLFVGPTLSEAVASSSIVMKDGVDAVVAISVFQLPDRRQYFLVQGGVAAAARRMLEAAEETGMMVVEAYGLASKLSLYEAGSEISDPALCNEIDLVLRRA